MSVCVGGAAGVRTWGVGVRMSVYMCVLILCLEFCKSLSPKDNDDAIH